MTSAFEGYPLASLESLSRGCPVVSYDIKYGPQEQITDGVDGFLVPNGDERTMADRIIALIDNPELVRSLSVAALNKAAQHDHRDTRCTLDAVLGADDLGHRRVHAQPQRELVARRRCVRRGPYGLWATRLGRTDPSRSAPVCRTSRYAGVRG